MNTGSKLKDWIHRQKDASVSMVAEKMLQKYLEPYGRLMDLALNSRQNTASIKVLLKGETEPLIIDIQEYELVQEPAGSYVTVKRATASREWLTLLLRTFLLGRRLDVPEKYATYAKMLL
jgi:hypothetical protein